MARNAEKAQSMLSLFRKKQMEDAGIIRTDKRPYLASEVSSLSECERWRRQIVTEIGQGVAKIQMASLSEYQVRELNDGINKLMREKGHWERRIKALGGPDHYRNGPRTDDDGVEAPGTKGYKYFGRARELPGVKELFTQAQPGVLAGEDSASDLRKGRRIVLDADYYGILDDNDEDLLKTEQLAEESLLEGDRP